MHKHRIVSKVLCLVIIRSLILVEVVVSLDDVPSVLNAKEIINLGRLDSLIDKYPMVVPFKETVEYCSQTLSFFSFIKI